MKKILSIVAIIIIIVLIAIMVTTKKLSPSHTIVCIGDSLTVCGGEDGKYTDWLAEMLPKDSIINKGVNGDTLAGGKKRFKTDILDKEPDIVVIALGANDFWQKKRTIDQLKADLEDMVTRAKQAGIEVVIASCFGKRDLTSEKQVEFTPDRFDFATAICKMEEQICKKYECVYVPNMQIDIKPNGKIPYWDDHNHPNKIGNEFVAKRIFEGIEQAKKKLK